MAFTLVSPQTLIARNAGALYGLEVGHTNMTNYAALVGTNPDAFLNTVYANSVGTTSTTTVANTLVANLGITDAAAVDTAVNYIVGQLNAVAYTARGAVINNIISLFSNMTGDATFGAYATTWNNQIATAVAYSEVPGNPDATWPPVVDSNYQLTSGTDIVPASKGYVTFTADQVYNPAGTARINSLQDEDNLTGTGTSTLNATLGNTGDNGGNVITPKLAGISTINAAFTGSGAAPNSTNAVLALDLQDATGVSVINVSRVSDTANMARIENVKSVLTDMGITNSNANNAGVIEFSFGAGVLKGLNTGNLNLSNVQVGNVNIGENTSLAAAAGVGINSYETLTINSAGATNTIGTLNLPMDTGVAGSVKLTGDQSLTLAATTNVFNGSTIESVTYAGGIAGANGRLATFDASALTGTAAVTANLGAGFFTTGKADTSGVVQNVAVTGSKNNDTFYLGDAIQTGDSLTGGDGQDTLVIYNQGNLISTGAAGSSLVTKIEALEDRQSTTGVSTVALDKLPDVTTILVRNEGSAAGVPVAATDTFTLNGMNTVQANAVTVQHSNTGSNGIAQNIINATLATNTAADAYTLTIAEGKNTNPRFNVQYNPTSAESVTIRDVDTESNTVALTSVAGVTTAITLTGAAGAATGGLAGTFLNLDTTTTGLNGGLYNFDTTGAGVTPTATLLTGVQDLSLTAGQAKIVAATFDASAELSNVIARFSTNAASAVGAQTITMGAGDDTVIFDNIEDSRAGLTGADVVKGGAGTDILAIDGNLAAGSPVGTVIALGASEWTGVSGFEQIKLIGAGNLVSNNGVVLGATAPNLGQNVAALTAQTYQLTLTDALIAANNANGVLAIVNDNDTANDTANTADTAGTAVESSVVIDARSLGNASRFSYNGEEGASRTNDRIIFSDVNFNGTHTLDGGAVDNNSTNNSGANLDVLEFRNQVNASAADFNNITNFGVIELTNDTSTTQVSTVELNDAIVDRLVDSYQAANTTTNVETLTLKGFDSTTVAAATTGLQLQAGTLTAQSNLNINLLNAGGVNTITTGAGVDRVVLSRTGAADSSPSAVAASPDTLNLGAGNDIVTILGNFIAGQEVAGPDGTGLIANVNALARTFRNDGVTTANQFGIDGIAGTADDAAAQLKFTDTIAFGAGTNTLYTYGAVDLSGATLTAVGGTLNIISASNIKLTAAEFQTMVASGGTLTFSGTGPHSLTIDNTVPSATALDLSKVIVTGTGTLAVATGGATTTNAVIAPVGITVTVAATLTPAVADTTAPVFSSASVSGTTLTLTYNEALMGTSDPAGSAFTVLVNGVARTVTTADANGTTVTLTLASAVTANDTVTVAYTVPGTNPIKDAAGNNAAALTATAVTNSTTGNTINLTAASAVVNLTTNTNASAVATAGNDTITSTYAQLLNSTIDALGGTDTLTVSDAITATFTFAAASGAGAAVSNVEVINLAGGSSAVVTGPNTSANLAINNTSATAASSVTLGTGATQSFTSTGTGVDTVVINAVGQSASLGAGNDLLSTTVAGTFTGTLDGGAGTDSFTVLTGASDFSGATLTGFETLVLGAASALTMKSAQYSQFTTITDAGGADSVTISDAATITTTGVAAAVGIETYTLGNFTNTVTLGGAADATRTITGGTGADTVNTTVANAFYTDFAAGTGTDILNITGGMSAALTLTTAGNGAAAMGTTGLETVNISGASTANALTIVSTVATDFTTINASGVTGGGISLTLTGLTGAATARTITLTDGNDTITNLKGTAGGALTVDFGKGVNTVTDLAVANTGGLLTLKASNAAGATSSVTFSATTADLVTGSATGTLLDFNTDVTAIAMRAIGSVGTNVAGQIFIDSTTSAGNTIITLDVDGNGVYGTGDVQIVITGQTYTGATGAIVGGNFQM